MALDITASLRQVAALLALTLLMQPVEQGTTDTVLTGISMNGGARCGGRQAGVVAGSQSVTSGTLAVQGWRGVESSRATVAAEARAADSRGFT